MFVFEFIKVCKLYVFGAEDFINNLQTKLLNEEYRSTVTKVVVIQGDQKLGLTVLTGNSGFPA